MHKAMHKAMRKYCHAKKERPAPHFILPRHTTSALDLEHTATPADMHTFEIPVFSAAAAKTAVDNGATRLEINRAGSYADGGLTPTQAEVQQVVQATQTVPLRVMIRPRGPPRDGVDFVYTDAEFRQMQADLQAFVASGLLSPARGDGFVFGILEATSTDRDSGKALLDGRRNRQLVAAAGAYACVLHRAFDVVVDAAAPGEALAAARSMGFSGVLTAGGPGARGAAEHVEVLRRLAAAAGKEEEDERRVEIIVGGGVRSRNVQALAAGILGEAAASAEAAASCVAFHSSCLADTSAAARDGAAGEVVDGAEVHRIQGIVSSL